MSKTRRSYHKDEYEEEISNNKFHEEKKNRYNDRIVNQALKSKNIEAFIIENEDEEDLIDDWDSSEIGQEEVDYVSCCECGKVLITEDDFKGAVEYSTYEIKTPEWVCAYCLKNEQDN